MLFLTSMRLERRTSVVMHVPSPKCGPALTAARYLGTLASNRQGTLSYLYLAIISAPDFITAQIARQHSTQCCPGMMHLSASV